MSTTWFPILGDGTTVLERVAANRPRYAAAMRDVERALWEQDVVEPELLDLCRRRIEQLLGCDGEGDDLRRWPTAPGFTERQRVALRYAEQLLIDAQGVTDADAARVVDALGEGGFLVLAYACGFFETTARAHLLLTAGGAS